MKSINLISPNKCKNLKVYLIKMLKAKLVLKYLGKLAILNYCNKYLHCLVAFIDIFLNLLFQTRGATVSQNILHFEISFLHFKINKFVYRIGNMWC